MKRAKLYNKNKFILSLLLGFILGLIYYGCASTAYNNRNTASEYDNYEDENTVLDRYGEWITVPTYGMVWRPFVSADWQPYYYGNWMRTENGWTWVSYEPFGWIVYHYGYWDYRPDTGWFWIESRDWAPARVAWIDYGDYIGWAPLPPPGAVLSQPGATQVNVWNIIETRNFLRDNVGTYRVRRNYDDFRAIQRGNDAPDINSVERSANREIRVVRTNRKRVNINGKQFERLVLPDREAATVRRYEPQIEREVIRTRDNNSGINNAPADNNRTRDNGSLRNNDGTRSNDVIRNNGGQRNTSGNSNGNSNTVRTRRNEGTVAPKPAQPKKPEELQKPAEPQKPVESQKPVEPRTPSGQNRGNEPTPAQRRSANTERSKGEKQDNAKEKQKSRQENSERAK